MGKEIYNDGKYRAVVVCGWNDTEEEVKRLCHYTNLQLLKAKDNLQKYCK